MEIKYIKNKCLIVFFLLLFFNTIGVVDLFPEDERKYSKIHLYLKVKGSVSFAKAGDFGKLIENNEIFFERQDVYDATLNKDSNFKGFGGEAGIEIDRYSIGIEFGYLSKEFDTSLNPIDTNLGYSLIRNSTLSVIPIFLNIHYSMINNPVFKVKTNLGFGMYLSKYKETIIETFNNNPYSQRDGFLKVNTYVPGLRIGMTLQVNIIKKIAFFAEGMYRVAIFRDFSGFVRYKDDYHLFDEFYKGYLFYYTHEYTGEGRFAVEGDLNADWTGEKMKSDLNGLALTVGIKFIF